MTTPFFDLATATQFALSIASQLQNAQEANATALQTADEWHDLADDLQRLMAYCNTTAARLDADDEEATR